MRRLLLVLSMVALMVAMMAVTAAPGFAQQTLPERVCVLEEIRQIPLTPRIGVPDEGGCTIITGPPPNPNPI